MEVVDENVEHNIEGNKEYVVDSHVSNDSHVRDSNGDGNQEPYIGMEFDSQENAHSFYAYYAKCVGFVFGIYLERCLRSLVMCYEIMKTSRSISTHVFIGLGQRSNLKINGKKW
jgi:hypothetical protein